jgi:Zn finger protein HypA/HybF involved in hydrogenase expression
MHEFSAVQAIVQALLTQLDREKIRRVSLVRIRRNSAFPEEILTIAFQAVTQGTPLESAQLVIETTDLLFECACGNKKPLTEYDLTGHMYLCPTCGMVSEVDGTHDLELIEVLGEALPDESF